MPTSNVRIGAADSGDAELQHASLSREQREFARTIGALLADKWGQAHVGQRADSDLEEQDESGTFPYANTRS